MKRKDGFPEHLHTANVWPQQVKKGFHREPRVDTKGTCMYNSNGLELLISCFLSCGERFPYGKAVQEVYSELVLTQCG